MHICDAPLEFTCCNILFLVQHLHLFCLTLSQSSLELHNLKLHLYQLLPLFIPVCVSLLISVSQATAFSFVCFSPSGFHGLCISGVLLLLLVGLGAPLGYLFELLLPLAVCAIAVSFLLSVYLYVRSFWAPTHALALGGNTGERGEGGVSS